MARRASLPTRIQIIDALVSVGSELGRAPFKVVFQAKTGISQNQLKRHFTSWNEALSAAGFRVNRYRDMSDGELLDDWGNATRKFGHCPRRAEYLVEGKYSANSFLRRFKSWAGVGRTFYTRSVDDPQWQDVI